MSRMSRVAAIIASTISIGALVLTAIGGALMRALENMFMVFRAGSDIDGATIYPLGSSVLIVYACGAALGLAALRWPLPAGFAMLPLGACAFLWGGPVAKVYAIAFVCTAAVVLLMRPRNRNT